MCPRSQQYSHGSGEFRQGGEGASGDASAALSPIGQIERVKPIGVILGLYWGYMGIVAKLGIIEKWKLL